MFLRTCVPLKVNSLVSVFLEYEAPDYTEEGIKEFKKTTRTFPATFVDPDGNLIEDAEEKWNNILDDIIFAFELCSDDEWQYQCNCKGAVNVLELKRKKGLKLFIEYYDSLWD